MYYYARQYDQALEGSQKWLEMFPNSLSAYIWLGEILEAAGMYDQMVTAWQKTMTLREDKPEDVAALGRAYKVGGIYGVWRWDLERLRKLPPEIDAAFDFAIRCASLGEKEEALQWLEKGYERRAPLMNSIKGDPRLDSLHSEPRFQDLLRRMNFPN
jgi:tetratricopeptide (TPR) repeat protein